MYSKYAESENSKNPFFIATVVDNEDSTYNYRIKVRLPKIHDKISDDKLPWAARIDRTLRGMVANPEETNSTTNDATNNDNTQNSTTSTKQVPPQFDHCVPEVGTKVLVLAIENDVNALVYLGCLYKKTDLTPTKEEDYLGTFGTYGPNGQFIGINCNGDTNKAIVNFVGDINVDKVKKITVKAEEEVEIETAKDITIKSTGSDTINITIINKNGNVQVTSKTLTALVTETAVIKSPKIVLNGDVHVTGTLSVDKTITAEDEITGGTTKINLSSHIHSGVESGADETGIPVSA